MNPTVVPDVLRKAASLIRDHGWTQKRDIDPQTGGLCANGAIRAALGQDLDQHPDFINGLGVVHRLFAPVHWSRDDYNTYATGIRAVHAVLDEFLTQLGHVDGLQASIAGVPLGIRFNDSLAKSGEHVALVMEQCAAWIEGHTDSVLNQIIAEAGAWPATTAAAVTLDLVLA